MSSVYTHVWPIWLSSAGRKTLEHGFVEGMTVRSVIPPKFASCNLRVLVNGSVEEDFERTLQPNDKVDIAVRPTGPFLPAFSGVLGAIFATSTVAANTFLALGFAGSFLSFLIGRSRGARKRGDEESPSFGFSGPANSRVEGLPKPVLYGQSREPGQIVDSFTVTRTTPPETDLYIVISFGEGPVEAIGNQTSDTDVAFPLSTEDPLHPMLTGVQVNGNNLENFNRVEAHVRLGTNAQKPIPGFQAVFTDYAVGAVLDQEQVATPSSGSISNGLLNPDLNLTTVAYNSNAADAQALWDEFGFSFDLTSKADSWKSIISFERGLYGISNTTGAVTNAGFQMLTRYMRLDDSGTPIASGGDNGDGWVYVFPAPIYVSRSQSQFALEFDGQFLDPSTYAAPTPGKYLDCSAASSFASTPATASLAGVPTQFSNGQTLQTFTVEGWFRFPTLGASGGTTQYKAMFEWGDASTSRGFAFGLKTTDNDFGGGGVITYWIPTLFLGTGSGSAGNVIGPTGSLSQIGIRGDYSSETPWFHLAVTYTRVGGAGGQSRTSFYLNGQLISQRLTSPIAGLGTAGTINFMRSLRLMSGSTFITPGKVDEAIIYTRELTAVEIQSRYNGGYGAAGSSSMTGLFEGWHMDVATNPGTYTITAGMSTNGATNLLTATLGTVGFQTPGVVFGGGAGTQLRSRYRVEHLRLNLRSTSSAIQDEATWSILYGKIDVVLAYPNSPLLALKITATEQLNSSAPTITTEGKWRIIKVWDGSGFSDEWTSNPAWVALDVLINSRYGRSWPIADIDLASFKEWADYCDGFVYDGLGNVQSIHESTGSIEIYDLQFDATKFDNYGGFAVLFRPGFVPPGSWVVGSFVGFNGLPVDGAVAFDINVTSTANPGIAFEIGEIFPNGGGGYMVWLRFDFATFGDPWSSGGFYSTATTTTPMTGTVRGYERRFSYDGAFDTFKPAWDCVMEICQTGRAVPIKEGNRIRIKYERPRDPVGIITHASIKPDSFTVQYSDNLDAANVVSIDIRDRAQNYERSPVEVFDPELDASAPEEEIERDSIRLDGVVRRSQATRHGLFMVAVNRLLVKSGSFETGPEALPYEVGDVLRLAHDVMPWGNSGRVGTGSTTTELVLDREIVLEPATTYFVSIRINALGIVGSGSAATDALEFVEVLEAAGTYSAGTSITVDTMSIAPSKDDPYILCIEGDELLCQIVEVRAREDHSRTIEWVLYDEAIYDVDTLPVDLPSAVIAPLTGAPAGPNTIPEQAQIPAAAESVRQTADGAWRSEVHVSWTHHDDTARFIGSTNLWWRFPAGAWDFGTTVEGAARNGVLNLPDLPSGTEIEIAIQAVSRGGARRVPDACPRIPLVVWGVSIAPPAPTDFAAHMEGDHVVYTWTPPDAARGLSYEVRRGRWLLGQVAATAAPGASRTPPLRAWVGGGANAAGDGPPPLVLRARDSRGQYSAAVTIDDFEPLPDGSTVLEDIAWEDYGATGWYDTGIPPVGAPSKSGLETVTVNGRVALHFQGSNLTGTYTAGGTSYVSKTVKSTPERVYVECFAVAEQVSPLTMDKWTLALDDPMAGRRTLEGPLVVLPGEPANCTLKIEWRTQVDGVQSDWMAYEPTVALIEAAEFRFTVTRPNTDYDVHVFQFHDRLTRIPKQRHERTPAQAYSMQRIMQHG